ncbi:Uncharacterised protein [Sphingobacterium spiritivorum]|uniref:Uncharacterized protein n=1 Tax=Sphingobacterium spiritivorum TaxID=258 RepID=A0A380C2F4_SPHSI|nr:Uncharacterised protein [Sphingobacterium spiritivorum]
MTSPLLFSGRQCLFNDNNIHILKNKYIKVTIEVIKRHLQFVDLYKASFGTPIRD